MVTAFWDSPLRTDVTAWFLGMASCVFGGTGRGDGILQFYIVVSVHI